MKTLYKILFIILFVSLITSCNKFLDKQLQGTLTQAFFPATPSDALLATNGAYFTLRDWYFHFGGYPILDIMSDDANKGSNPDDQSTNLIPYNNFTFTPSQDGLDRWWASLYQGIKRCNVVIEKVPLITMDATLQNRYVAEAKFIRALIYFDLVRAWGAVPIVTTTTPQLGLTRSPKETVYALILSDLNFALNNLPEKNQYNSIDMGRATKGATRALLARVYLFQGDFVNTEKYTLDVINSSQYSLEPNFIDANGVNGNNGVESVFEASALPYDDTGKGGDQFGNTQGVRGSPNRGWGFNRPTLNLRYSFEPGDPRVVGTIIDLGQVIDGVLINGDPITPDSTMNAQGVVVERECYSRKVWTPGTDVPTQWGYHRRLIRYADVLLMAAEASNENNKPTQALQYLNMVRARARGGNSNILPDIIVTDQTQLRAIILNERRHELALENFRFWDLVRTNNAATVLGPYGFIKGKHELLPIPQSEIDISQGTLTQNANW